MSKPVNATADVDIASMDDGAFLEAVKTASSRSSTEFARAYYLFATARLVETYNSEEIHNRYPILNDRDCLLRMKRLLDAEVSVREANGSPDGLIEQDSDLKRLFVSSLNAYLDAQMAPEADALENASNALTIPVGELGLKDDQGQPITELLYEDVPGWMKKTADKQVRETLSDLTMEAANRELSERFIALLMRENTLMAELGFPDVLAFHEWASGHHFLQLGEQAQQLLTETDALYRTKMSARYAEKTGLDFSKDATRADIAFVLHGPSPEMSGINAQFPRERLVSLARETFDGLGLRFSELAVEVDCANMEEYEAEVVQKTRLAQEQGQPLQRILLDIALRNGKPSRAYVYPSVVPSEIYLSVKPEGGLDDYLSFFHESGHAQHFAYESPTGSYARNLLGNNAATETYAYLFQNLFLNRHWLTHKAGLSEADAGMVVSRRALEDLYMLRRYASKMLFELELFKGVNDSGYLLDSKGSRYATLLTEGCGFRYLEGGWTRDVDARFYVADYFTAWTLEAQLRRTLGERFGSSAVEDGEDWYLNPEAGAFLRDLWSQGNVSQHYLCRHLGYDQPTELAPLLHFMDRNLAASSCNEPSLG